jgi:hypothetical protein
MYFATWDSGLVKINTVTPMDFSYDAVALPVTINPIKNMIDMYVSMMYNSSLGHIGKISGNYRVNNIIANLHLVRADMYGANHSSCITLAMLHNKAVDSAKTGNALPELHTEV